MASNLEIAVLLLLLDAHSAYLWASCDANRSRSLSSKFDLPEQQPNVTVRLLDLIHKFSSVLSLETEAGLMDEVRSALPRVLEDFKAQVPSCGEIAEVLRSAVVGVFRLSSGVTKDCLARGKFEEVNRRDVFNHAYWQMDVLRSLLSLPVSTMTNGSCSISELINAPLHGKSILQLSVELRMIEPTQLFLDKGASVCAIEMAQSGESVENVACECVEILKAAVSNGDREMCELIAKEILRRRNYLHQSKVFCDVINSLCKTSSQDFSPFQIAYLHCTLLNVCEVYDYLTSLAGPNCAVNSNTTSMQLLSHVFKYDKVCPLLRQEAQVQKMATKKRHFRHQCLSQQYQHSSGEMAIIIMYRQKI